MPTVPLLASVADLSASQIAGASSQLVPSGVVMAFAGATAPSGWLLCNGSLVSRATYATLFDALSPSQTCNTTNASATITVQDSSVMSVGMSVFGAGIQTSATISSITNATTIVLSSNATATGTGVSLRFGGFGTGDGSTTFALPDYRGRFMRGRDGSIARDLDRASRTAASTGGNIGDNVGSVQGNATARPNTSFATEAKTVTGTISNNSYTNFDWQDYSWDGVGSKTGFAGGRNASGAGGTPMNLGSFGGTHGHGHTLTSPSANVTGGGDNETRPLNAYVNYIIKI